MTIGGYRITESGDARVLETSTDLRVTENLYAADAALNATGSSDYVATLNAVTSASVNAAGSLAAVAQVKRYGAILVANNSSIEAAPHRTTVGAATLTATGSVSATSIYAADAAASFSSTGSASFDARTVKYANVESGLVAFTRSPESDYEDVRITESSDVRVTELIKINTVEGTLIADATKIPFSSTMYVKRNGTWSEVTALKVKRSGVWVTPIKMNHKLPNGLWKRIY